MMRCERNLLGVHRPKHHLQNTPTANLTSPRLQSVHVQVSSRPPAPRRVSSPKKVWRYRQYTRVVANHI
eukprot:4293297-Prymnesium_polylepis.1